MEFKRIEQQFRKLQDRIKRNKPYMTTLRERIDRMVSRRVTKIIKNILKDYDLLGIIKTHLRWEIDNEKNKSAKE